MSSVDERVVEMQFKNEDFEKGVRKSLISLKNLKQGLNLDKSTKSLSNLESTANNFSIKNLASSVASISDRFSTMGIIGMTALQNITNSAIATGKTLVSALTIDPVKSGFQEYETQINAVQTILANTESKGTTLDQVNAALDELNRYADMTIYNFTEMTRNIGTFTAAGVDLDTSVEAIKGIANLAAVSGSNSQQASTAMYQLSQALAAGTVKLQDWNSVVNAGMGGQVFQDALKETARVHGVAIDQMIKDEGSFRETLSKGWITSDVLTETLAKFTGDLNESQLKTMGYTDEQIASIIKMGKTANDAATKVKTVSQLFDTLKEAMQSGWTQSWEYIVGDFEQAKESLTAVSDVLSNIINNSANKRNDLLQDALTSNYDKFIKTINDAGIETTVFQDRVKAAINENGGDADVLIQKYGTLEKAIRAGAVSSDLLKKSLGGMSKESLNIDRLLHFKDAGDDVKNIQEALKQLGYDLSKYGTDGLIGSETTAAIKAFQQAKGLSVDGIVGPDTVKALQDAVGSTDKLKSNVDEMLDNITKKGGRDLGIETIGYAWKGLIRIAHDVKAAYKDIFPKEFTSDDLYGIIQKLHDLSFNLLYNSEVSDKIQRSFRGLFSALNLIKRGFAVVTSPIKNFIGSGGLASVGNALLNVSASIGDFFTSLNESAGTEKFFTTLSDGIENTMKDIMSAVDPALEKVESLGDVFSAVKTVIVNSASNIFDVVKNVFTWISDNVSAGDIFAGLAGGGIFVAAKKFSGLINTVKDNIKNLFKGVKASKIKEQFSDILGGVKDTLSSFTTGIKVASLVGIAAAIAILSVALNSIAKIEAEKIIKSLTAIGVMLGALSGTLFLITKILSANGSKGLIKAGASLVLIAEAVKILADAMVKMSDLSWEEIEKGLTALGGGLLELSVALKIINGTKVSLSTSVAMIALAEACKVLGDALAKFATFSWDEIARGLTAMGGALAELTVSLSILSKAGGFGALLGGTGMLIAVQSLDEISQNLERLGKLSWDQIGHGLVAMGGTLGEFIVALSALSAVGGFGSLLGGTGILVAVQSLDEISENLKKLGSLSWDEIGHGLAAMGGALGELTASLSILSVVGGFGSLLGATGILVAVQALYPIATALSRIGGMTWDEITKGLVGMGGSLTELAVISGLLGNLGGLGALIGSGSLLLGVQGLGDLADALKKFGTMDWDEIGRGLTAMAGALGETALGGLLNTFSGFGAGAITEMAAPLGDLAESIKKWSGVTVPEGLGIQLGSLAEGVRQFNFSGWGADAIGSLGIPLGDLADSIKKWNGVVVPDGIGTGLTDLAGGIKSFNFAGWGVDNVSELVVPLGDLAGSIKKWNGVSIPSNMETNMSSMAAGINAWSSVEVHNIDSCIEPVGNFADSIRKWNGVVIPDGLKEGLTSLADGLQACNAVPTDNLSEISDHASAIKSIVTDLTNGMNGSDSVGTTIVQFGIKLATFYEYVNKVDTSKINSVSAAIKSMYDTMSKCQGSFDTSGMQTYLSSMNSSMSEVNSGVTSSMNKTASAASNGINKVMSSMTSTVRDSSGLITSSFSALGTSMITQLIQGMNAMTGRVASSAGQLASVARSAVASWSGSFYSLGVDAANGYANGISAGTNAAVNAAANMAARAIAATQSRQKSHSPSKIFHGLGVDGADGYTNGFIDSSKNVANAASTMVSAGINAAASLLSSMDGEINTSPVITPVIDDSQVLSGIQSINNMMNNLTVSRNMQMAGASFGVNQNGDNSDVVSAINGLRKDILNRPQNVYTVNGITYDDGSNVSDAVGALIKAVQMDRRA